MSTLKERPKDDDDGAEDAIRVPHLVWNGPGPERETEQYLLAILLRLAGCDMKKAHERTPDMPATTLTDKRVQCIAPMYAYMRKRLKETKSFSLGSVLILLSDEKEFNVRKWVGVRENRVLWNQAKKDLMQYVEKPGVTGFSCYG